MSDDLSLLLRIRGDAAGAKAATAETRAAIASLRGALGSDFNAMQKAGESALAGLGDHLNVFVGQRIPLVGGSFVRLTENLRGFGQESSRVASLTKVFDKSVDDLAKTTGKSKEEIIKFVGSFAQLPSALDRGIAGYTKFGSKFDELEPKLEKAALELGQVAAAGESAGAGLAAAAGPIGIAVLAALALAAAAALITKEFLDLTIQTAEWQGKLLDLSQQTGVNVETLSALEVVAKTTGSDIGQLTASLGIFQKNLEAAQDPTSKQAALLKDLGIESTNTEDALRESLKVLAAMPEGYRQTAAALELFGRGGKSFLAIAKELNGDLDGMIDRLRKLGVIVSTEDAKAADEFNDQLAVLGFQIRATTATLVQDAIPAILKGARAVSDIVKENRDTINALGAVIGLFVQANVNQILLPALKTLEFVLNSVRDAWLGTRVAALVALGQYAEAGAVIAEFNSQIEKANQGLAALKSGEGSLGADPIQGGLGGQRLAEIKALADAESQAAKERIANAQIAFDQGKSSREKESAEIIAALAKERNARIEALSAEIAIKRRARDARKDDIAEQEKLGDELRKLDQERLNVQSDFNQKVKAEEAKLLADQNKAFIDHAQNQLALRQKASDNEIKLIQDAMKNNEVAASAGEAAITEIQKTALDDRRSVLNQELALHGLSATQREQITQKIAELEIEATNTQKEQAERRKQILRDEYDERLRLIQAANARELALTSTRDDLLIAREEAFAAARIKSNEDAARAILAIRAASIKAQIDQLGQERAAAVALPDRKKGDELEAELINKQKILQLQLEKIQLEGNAAVERARQQDLENAQHYADELTRINKQAVDAVKDAVAAASKAIAARPFENAFRLGLDTGQLAEMANGIQSFRDVAIVAFSAVGAAVNGLAQGVGSLVQNWVLMGSTGPDAMRKLVASVLSGVAAQSAVLAIFELAKAFASLFFNPAEAAAHFQAAALFGSVAVAAAVSGRAIAGSAFQKEAGGTSIGGSSSRSGSSSSSGSSAPKTTDIDRRASAQPVFIQPIVHVTINGQATEGFRYIVEKAITESYRDDGKVRDILGHSQGIPGFKG